MFVFFNFLKFLKNDPEYIDPSGHFVFYDIFWNSNYYYSFSSMVEKLNLFAINESIILIFLVNLSFLSIYILLSFIIKKEIQMQPPREQHLCEVLQGNLE